jgi:hypothetical protein
MMVTPLQAAGEEVTKEHAGRCSLIFLAHELPAIHKTPADSNALYKAVRYRDKKMTVTGKRSQFSRPPRNQILRNN